MNRLIDITKTDDILREYRDTPIEHLLEFHNLNKPLDSYSQAELLIGMCMDNRKKLRLPNNFAFVIRAGGANLTYSDFNVSYAIAVGNVKHVAIIGHSNCGMVNLNLRKEQYVNGLVENAGWEKKTAEEDFLHTAPIFEIGNEIDFVIRETKRLRLRYPKIIFAPLYYKVENNRLFIIDEN